MRSDDIIIATLLSSGVHIMQKTMVVGVGGGGGVGIGC